METAATQPLLMAKLLTGVRAGSLRHYLTARTVLPYGPWAAIQ